MAKTWQIILATVAIFVAGLVTGAATAVGVLGWIHRHHAFAARPNSQAVSPQLMRGFALQLDLTRDQRMRIGAIMRRASRLIHDEIGDILTPEQRVKFDTLIREQRARFQQRHQEPQERGGPRPEPAPTETPK